MPNHQGTTTIVGEGGGVLEPILVYWGSVSKVWDFFVMGQTKRLTAQKQI
jgi:hypothetical protein